MALRTMSLLVYVDGKRVDHTGYNSTGVSRGGFETCTFQIPSGTPPKKGVPIRVYDGLSTVWYGYVDEAGHTHDRGARGANVTGLGRSADFNRDPYSMIYIDRDLNSRWGSISQSRRASLASTWNIVDPTVSDDNASANPGIVLDTTEDVIGSSGVLCEAWYDAGAGNLVGRFLFGVTLDTTAASSVTVYASSDDITTVVESLNAASSVNIPFDERSPTTPRRNLIVQALNSTAATAPRRRTIWNVIVMGDHGLTLRSVIDAFDGILATEILMDAIERAAVDVVLDSLDGPGSNYVVPHCVYPTPVPPAQVLTDMITLLGWTWGVWEPDLFGSRPRMTIGAPPSAPTCVAHYEDCTDVDINDSLSNLHDSIIVTYQDAAGKQSVVEITKEHPGMPPGVHNAMSVNLGVTDTARTQGLYLLALDQDQTRAVGGLTLPPFVQTLGGGIKPSHLLRPGLDRLTIQGLPNTGSLVSDSNSSRGDTFLIERISVTEDDKGVITTTAELDSGLNLTETLNARVDLDHQIVGVGG